MNDPDDNTEPKKKKEKIEIKTENTPNDALLRDKSNLACSFDNSDKVQTLMKPIY